MTPQLEKVFFNYILANKKYFDIVKPFFFRNSEIQFVYGVIRNYMLVANDSKIPTPRQILDMVNLEDKEGVITKEILKSVLQVDLKEYETELKRITESVVSQYPGTSFDFKVIEQYRNMKEILQEVKEVYKMP